MPPKTAQLTAIRNEAIAQTLRRCQLFADLPRDALERVAATCVLRKVPRGGYLFRERDAAEGFYVVHTGSINVHRVTPDGKEQVIRIFQPGDSFAEVALATVDTYPADAVAVEASQVILVQRAPFRELVRREPEMALRILASMSGHLRYLVQRLEDLQGKHAETRLAHWLARQCPPGATRPVLELAMTKRLLAGQLGIASETLSRILGKFREAGLIGVDGQKITIYSVEDLLGYLSRSDE